MRDASGAHRAPRGARVEAPRTCGAERLKLFARQPASEVLAKLRERHPEQEFAFDGNQLRGKNQVVYLSTTCQ